jgi:hypothetical protein
MRMKALLAGALAVLAVAFGVSPASAVEPEQTGRATTVQDLIATPNMYIDVDCRYGYLCTWHGQVRQDFYRCQRIWLTNWTGTGMFINQQTPGTVTTFYDRNGKVLSRSVAQHWIRSIDWNPIWSFQVC